MLAPSKAIPSGSAPTLKVPSSAPVLAASFVTLFPEVFATHILAPVKSQNLRAGADGVRTKHCAVARPKLGDGAASILCDPDVSPIKHHSHRKIPHGKSPERRSVIGSQLGHSAVPDIGNPHVSSVKYNASRQAAYRECGCPVYRIPPQNGYGIKIYASTH